MNKESRGTRLNPEFRAFVLEKRNEGWTSKEIYDFALEHFGNRLPSGYIQQKRIQDLIYHESHKYEAKQKALARTKAKAKPKPKRTYKVLPPQMRRAGSFNGVPKAKKDEILQQAQDLRAAGFNWSSVVDHLRAEHEGIMMPSATTFQRLFKKDKSPKKSGFKISLSGLNIQIQELEIPRGIALDVLKLVIERSDWL